METTYTILSVLRTLSLSLSETTMFSFTQGQATVISNSLEFPYSSQNIRLPPWGVNKV